MKAVKIPAKSKVLNSTSRVQGIKTRLKKCLKNTGIQPISFAYFLTEFQKKETTGKTKLAKLLMAQLKAEAELINYHLNHI